MIWNEIQIGNLYLNTKDGRGKFLVLDFIISPETSSSYRLLKAKVLILQTLTIEDNFYIAIFKTPIADYTDNWISLNE